MKKTLLAKAIALGALVAMPMAANAAFVEFNNLTNINTVGKVASPIAVGGLSVLGGQTNPPSSPQPLTIANFGAELGLGVCGTTDLSSSTLCDSNVLFGLNKPMSLWNGQIDELENLGADEYITISEAGADMTGQFRLGSFDSTEAGTITDGTTTTTFQRQNNGTVTLNDTGGGWTSSIVELSPNNVWLLTLTGFSSAITSVTFTAGCGVATTNNCLGLPDNDYLVAAASVVPIPAAAWLFGSAIVGTFVVGRRKKAAAAGGAIAA